MYLKDIDEPSSLSEEEEEDIAILEAIMLHQKFLKRYRVLQPKELRFTVNYTIACLGEDE